MATSYWRVIKAQIVNANGTNITVKAWEWLELVERNVRKEDCHHTYTRVKNRKGQILELRNGDVLPWGPRIVTLLTDFRWFGIHDTAEIREMKIFEGEAGSEVELWTGKEMIRVPIKLIDDAECHAHQGAVAV